MTAIRMYWKEVTKNRIAYLFLVPALASLLVVQFLPIAQGVALSFQDYVIYRPKDRPWVGLQNYVHLFQDPLFIRTFWQSWYWTIGSVLGQFTIGMIAALLMNRIRRGWFRGLMLIPWVVPSVLAAMMFGLLFTSVGLVNTILMRLGLMQEWFPWLSNSNRPCQFYPDQYLEGIPVFCGHVVGGHASRPARA